MMRYVVTHEGREIHLDVEPDGEGRYRVVHEGRAIEADLRPAGGRSLFSLILDRQAYDVSMARQKDRTAVTIRGRDLVLSAESEQARNARLVEGSPGVHGPHTVQSIMPGRVVRVLVREGEEVHAGTPLLILEAMKMENEIRSVSSGSVSRIVVNVGQAVVNGDPLVVIS